MPLPTGSADAAHLRAVIARSVSEQAKIKPRSIGTSKLYQFVVGVPYQLLGETQPYGAFTPQNALLTAGAQFQHVTPLLAFPIQPSGHIEYEWTLPDSTVSSVGLEDPDEPQRLFSFYPTDGVVRLTCEYTAHPGPAPPDRSVTLFSIRYLLQGVEIMNVREIPVEHAVQDLPEFPLFPRFGCGVSGGYSLKMTVDGQIQVDEHYRQKALRFQPELPSLTDSGGQPVSVDSSFEWDLGSPDVSGLHPSWRVSLSDGSRRAEAGSNHVQFTWDPVNRILGRHTGPPVDPPIFDYTVVAEADAYELLDGSGFKRYVLGGGGNVPGSRAVLVHPALFPTDSLDPTRGESIELRGSVNTVGYTHPDVHWDARIEGPDGQEVKAFQSPSDASSFAVFETWNGRNNLGESVPPGRYNFIVHAEATEGEDDGIGQGRQEQLRHTGLGLFPQEATESIPITVVGRAMSIVSLTALPDSIQAGETGPVVLEAVAQLQGAGQTPPEANWHLQVLSPDGAPVFAASSTQAAPSFRVDWPAVTTNGGPLPPGTYRVLATATTPEGLIAQRDLDFVVGRAVSVSDLAINPRPVALTEPEPGTYVSAKVTPAGYTEPFAAAWTLTISPRQGGDPVRTLRGTIQILDLQGATSFETFWNGRNEGDQLVEPGPYRLHLVVDPCAGSQLAAVDPTGVGAGACAEKGEQGLIAYAGPPHLEVFDDSQVLLAVSKVGAQLTPASKALLLRIHPLRQGQATNVTIKASNLEFSGTQVIATVTGKATGTEVLVPLSDDQDQDGVYEGTVDLATVVLVGDQFKVGGETVESTYTGTDAATAGAVTTSLFQKIAELVDSIPNPVPLNLYRSPSAPLGKLLPPYIFSGRPADDPQGPLEPRDPEDDEALTLPRNVTKFGFEPVTVQIDTQHNPGLEMFPVKAVLKVGHPAALVNLTMHGGSQLFNPSRAALETGVSDPDDGSRKYVHPEVPGGLPAWETALEQTRFVSTGELAAIKTILFTSCNVLDLRDYNSNNFPPEKPLLERSAYTSTTLAPGQIWWKAVGNSNALTHTVLLGYNHPVTGFAAGNSARVYVDELKRLSGNPAVSNDDLQQMAWMSANMKLSAGGSTALNACAWDGKYYWYIAYTPPMGEAFTRRIEEFTVFGIYRIPLNPDGDNSEILPPTAGVRPEAEEITVP